MDGKSVDDVRKTTEKERETIQRRKWEQQHHLHLALTIIALSFLTSLFAHPCSLALSSLSLNTPSPFFPSLRAHLSPPLCPKRLTPTIHSSTTPCIPSLVGEIFSKTVAKMFSILQDSRKNVCFALCFLYEINVNDDVDANVDVNGHLKIDVHVHVDVNHTVNVTDNVNDNVNVDADVMLMLMLILTLMLMLMLMLMIMSMLMLM